MGGWKRLPCLDFLHLFSLSTNSGQSIKYGKFSNMNSPTKAPLRVRSSEVTRTCQSQTTFLFTFILNQANKKTSKTMGGLYEVESLQRSISKECILRNQIFEIFCSKFPPILLDFHQPTKVLPREALTTHQTCWNLANMTLVWRVFVDS